MDDGLLPNSVDLFAAAVQRGLITWQEIVGFRIKHRHFGSGVIIGTEPGRPYQHLRVHFEDPAAEKVLSETVFSGGIIRDIVLPAALATRLRSRLEQELLAQKQREVEAQRRLAEEAAREQPIRTLAARALLSLEQVRKDRWLHTILQRLSEDGDLTDDEISKLRERGSVTVIAIYYELLARRSGRRGYLATASSCWQEAGYPKKALEITEPAESDSLNLPAVLLTTRGAAFRKLGNLAEARRCALEALNQNPDSRHACNLLAGIYHQLGESTKGHQYFLIAAHYEARAGSNDHSTRQIVAQLSPEQRRLAAALLLRQDAEEYSWAKQYLK